MQNDSNWTAQGDGSGSQSASYAPPSDFTVVPEPSSTALLGLGGLALLARRRR
ncbi:MAG: PEP-CTERM sorting domain-containing protein [Akkermansiaceae bacterium]